MDTLSVRLGVTRGRTFLFSGTIPQAYPLLMSLNVAKCNLGLVKRETMLASCCSLGIGAGWPGALRRSPSVAYSLASDVKSFFICFRYWIVHRVYSQPASPSWHGKY